MSTPAVLFITLLVCMVLGVPIAWSLSISCICALLSMGNMPMILLTQRVFNGANNFSFLAVPAFVVAGEVMSQGGISKKLTEMAAILFGRMRGSFAIVSVVASTIFAALSGSGPATVMAIGNCKLIKVPKTAFLSLIRKNPHYGIFLSKMLAQRLALQSQNAYVIQQKFEALQGAFQVAKSF